MSMTQPDPKADAAKAPTKPAPIPNSGALERVVLRNNFYRDNYRRLMVVCLGLILITLGLGAWGFYERANKPPPQYFATTFDGKLIPLIPLDQPSLSDNQLLQWSTEAAVAAYTFNYVNYRKALQDVRIYFTKTGYQYFLKALRDSNNLQAVIDKKMIVSATPTGAPIILRKGILNDGTEEGIYSWQVQLPMEIFFQSEQSPITQNIILTMIITRVPTLESPSGVGIASFVIREGKA